MAAPATAGGAEAAGAEGSGPNPAWDTPAARELRAKIKSLEREARKREIVLKVSGRDGMGWDRDRDKLVKGHTPHSPTLIFWFWVEGGGHRLCVLCFVPLTVGKHYS